MELINKKIPFIKSKKKYELNYEESLLLFKACSNIQTMYYLYKINGVVYHQKRLYKEDVIDELLGKIISEYFGDKCVLSKIIRVEYNRFYLLSENFIEVGHNYTNLNNGLFPYLKFDNNGRLDLFNLDLLDRIKFNGKIIETDKDDFIKLKYDLKKMIVSDFIRNQSDRVYRNFLIKYDNNHCSLMPLYDFEYSFFNFDKELVNSFIFEVSEEKVANYVKRDEGFQKLLYKAMDMNMKKIFEKLFDEYPVRMNSDEIIKYENLIDDKKKDIKKYKLIR